MKRNLVAINRIAMRICRGYNISCNGALYAAKDLWDAYTTHRDGEAYPGEAVFWGVCAVGYLPRKGKWGSASLACKGSEKEDTISGLFMELWDMMREVDNQ